MDRLEEINTALSRAGYVTCRWQESALPLPFVIKVRNSRFAHITLPTTDGSISTTVVSPYADYDVMNLRAVICASDGMPD